MDKNTLQMVQQQLIPRGISDKRVLSAMEKVPRHLFVPEKLKEFSYEDGPLPIGEGQTISQPYMVAWMSELLKLTGKEKVLEIGTGSGYQTAVLAELADEIYTVETIEVLSSNAQRILNKMGYKNIFFKTGDGTLGWDEKSPFDRILITAAADKVPPKLFEQLAEKGKMVVPLGERYFQLCSVVEKINGKMTIQKLDGCTFVPLVGKYGMGEDSR
ncbi:MAG: protein-L-isoaspartate(D-aspartate) O-methyltransferase [Elusimicrobia bacterium]|nr:protein-L-isoaspartate(D-aspartate) O-methyltransferase [Elusimicrobiota bacterium]